MSTLDKSKLNKDKVFDILNTMATNNIEFMVDSSNCLEYTTLSESIIDEFDIEDEELIWFSQVCEWIVDWEQQQTIFDFNE